MAVSIHAPRINNNDDQVKLIALDVAIGQKVDRGAVIGQVETDKAVVDIEAPAEGYVIGLQAEVDTMVEVGSILVWLGESADEVVPAAAAVETRAGQASGAPTAKARLLLKRHGLTADQVPAAGERLTAEDVEHYVAGKGGRTAQASGSPVATRIDRLPDVPGALRPLRPDERGMVNTVSWSRDFAVPGYIELEYDPQPWDAYAKDYADRHRLMLSPLLSLMAWRLVELARETPALNATHVGEQRYEYGEINLGFTVQAGETLYLTVLRNADTLDESGFVNAQGDIQRRAAGHRLVPAELQGATISFSSMARWKVSRHIPILPPHTALMVAHAVSADGRHVLGATYDHRVLNGFQVVNTLRKLSKPAVPDRKKENTQ
ncbi:2-oxo acid dehydrogenase subunit E2 [Zoogloea sp. LCSB751]|uniref:2-oxo acid dehydrogenase subunit E2 n=1 Tax=Zoogloea sp. LCSB751 TaxID=1965277 RepID=UPI0009A4A90A|nr:2-oxo acid dehydrogenase subunit E2 [Zoogloea sp. LCSB751]